MPPNAKKQSKRPIFGWDNLRGGGTTLPSVSDARQRWLVSSGRAAIYHAVRLLKLPADACVLVPTYHCPTMVAPVLLAGARVVYFGITEDGLPDLAALNARPAQELAQVRALIAAHYFGLPRSFAAVRQWCDERGIALIEDCAHCYFGQAGERRVGAWGDLTTASVSKFFPVAEGGLLCLPSAVTTPAASPQLERAPLKLQIKSLVDVLELASQRGRLPGLNGLLGAMFRLKNRGSLQAQALTGDTRAEVLAHDAAGMMHDCDMDRREQAATAVTRWMHRLPRGRMVARRQANYRTLHQALSNVPGVRPLFDRLPDNVAPYVMPLWADSPEPLYAALREAGCAVFRWDQIWPDVPKLAGDHGALWSRHTLQLLCHQELDADDLAFTVATVRRCTAESRLNA